MRNKNKGGLGMRLATQTSLYVHKGVISDTGSFPTGGLINRVTNLWHVQNKPVLYPLLRAHPPIAVLFLCTQRGGRAWEGSYPFWAAK